MLKNTKVYNKNVKPSVTVKSKNAKVTADSKMVNHTTLKKLLLKEITF